MLIRGETLVGVFSTEEEAYQAGIKQFAELPFLIARVEEGEPPCPAGLEFLRQMGFFARAGMSDEDIDRFLATVYKDRSHQHPREVDLR